MNNNAKNIISTSNTFLRETRINTLYPVGDGTIRKMRQIDLQTSIFAKFNIKISLSSISMMETRGLIPHMAVAYAISDILDKPVDELFPRTIVLKSWQQQKGKYYLGRL